MGRPILAAAAFPGGATGSPIFLDVTQIRVDLRSSEIRPDLDRLFIGHWSLDTFMHEPRL